MTDGAPRTAGEDQRVRGDAQKAWMIAGGGFLAAVAIAVGLIALSSWLVDSADRHEPPPAQAQHL